MDLSLTLSDPIVVLGAGASGLIHAHVLLQDGFTDVTLITRDKSVGGTWARERIYPELRINNVQGEYRFSMLDMPPPSDASKTGGRLSGLDMCNYFESFADLFLVGKAKCRFDTEILNVARLKDGKWEVSVEHRVSGLKETLSFSRVILATGGCSAPSIPPTLSPEAAAEAGFRGPVLHSSLFVPRLQEIVAEGRRNHQGNDQDPAVVVVGGGKSAQDISSKLFAEGCKVVNVFETADVFLASASPLPGFIRKSRLLSALSPHRELNSALERFLHTTTIGGAFVRFMFKQLENDAFNAFNIPADSPLRNTHSMFWGVRLNDDGVAEAHRYQSLVVNKKIQIAAPARALNYASDGKSVVLNNGQTIRACAVILATGYQSSWSKIFTPEMAQELGIDRRTPSTKVTRKWNYTSLQGGPSPPPEHEIKVTTLYRGLVPAKNILKRDFAVAGTLFTANFGYTSELTAHWISSYFRGDKMRLPGSVDDAIRVSEEQCAWMRTRYPTMHSWVNESYSGSLDFLNYPQAGDELLDDLHLPSCRTGGNWLTWVFKPISVASLATVGEERRALRNEARKSTI